jgi:biopolymer transport protein ExbB/TolQ
MKILKDIKEEVENAAQSSDTSTAVKAVGQGLALAATAAGTLVAKGASFIIDKFSKDDTRKDAQ